MIDISQLKLIGKQRPQTAKIISYSRKKGAPQSPRMALSAQLSWLYLTLMGASSNILNKELLRPSRSTKITLDEYDNAFNKTLKEYLNEASVLSSQMHALAVKVKQLNKDKAKHILFDDD